MELILLNLIQYRPFLLKINTLMIKTLNQVPGHDRLYYFKMSQKQAR